jgi:hypothetical protein
MNNRNARLTVKRATSSTGRLLADWIAATWDFFLIFEMFALGLGMGLAAGLLTGGVSFTDTRHLMVAVGVRLLPLLPVGGVFNMLRYGRDVGRLVPRDGDLRDANSGGGVQ